MADQALTLNGGSEMETEYITNPPEIVTKPLFPTAIEAEDKTNSNAMVTGQPVPQEFENADLYEQYNESGFLDGEQESNVYARVFINRGKTGSARVHWGGGAGGLNNQSVGAISLTAPILDGIGPPKAGAPAEAWVRPGTGRARVTRSFTGVLVGANGVGLQPNGPIFITARAAGRIDTHERLHITTTKRVHDMYITLLEDRVRRHTGKAKSLKLGATKADAIASLRTFIGWNTTVANFRADDRTENTPGGKVDTADWATADFYRDYGPRVVKGKNFAHYYDTQPGP